MDADQGPDGNNPTIIAVFENLSDAEYGLAALGRTGLNRDDVSLIVRDADADAAALRGGDTGANVMSGATTGATVGGLVGGLAGGLLALLVPGLGPMLGTGVLANMLAGLAVGAAGGGILGALLGLGVPEEEAAIYADHLQAGRVLMSIIAASPTQAQAVVAALETSNAYEVRIYGGSGGSAAAPAVAAPPVAPALPAPPAPVASVAAITPVASIAPVAPVWEPVDRTLAAPPPPEQPAPLISGDVAAVAEGGPDVRGESGASGVANRGLTDADADLSAWRSGGDAARPESPAERGLDAGPGAVLESEAANAGGGDVVAVAEGGPDVRPPGATSDSRELEGAEVVGADWADDPTDWRSGGEEARAETGEGVSAAVPAAPTDRSLDAPAPSPAATPPATPEAAPPDDAYYTNPRLLSRSALRYAISDDSAAPADRGLEAEVANPNPEGYGDGGTE